jgi:DNA gyrase subunit A
MEVGTVRQIDIDQEMQGAYLDYAMSVIVARALPDVRDGLKPVHRRILYAMHDMGIRPDSPYKKSARIVGEVLGKYHPHGDAAVYEAMARMAQDFSLRYVLVDGQGNFGSIDGDSPAAMRYTEARMARIAMELLADIDKQTVEFVPNFDDTLTEPAVLPAALPNLLVSGASGIAVGMTTNIPPHNLAEVCDALVYLIDNFKKLDDVTVEDLTRFVHGPDFPTGGVVYRYADDSGDGDRVDLVRNAYALGRGRLTVQSQVHIEEMSRNRNRIVVTELPYQVNKTRLIERIAELVRDGRIEGITDLRDESDRQGMRICIELTRTVQPRDILSQLFKLTPMQTTFGMRMLALVDGEPRLLSLKRVLIHYLEHRQEIITRRSHYLLERAKQRAHILEGLLKALDNIDKVIDIIRRSRTTETARNNLMSHLELTEVQAQAILDMPLKRLAALERRKISDEHKERLKEIKYLQSLLRSPVKIRGVIREDLLALKAQYGDARRTHIVDQEKGHHTARDLVEEEDVLLTLWHDGQVGVSTKTPRVSSKAAPVTQVWGNTRDDVAFFSASGQTVTVALHQVPGDHATPVSSLAELDRSESVVSALILPHALADEELPETYLTLVTRGARIKRIALADFVATASRGVMPAMKVEGEDQLAWVVETSGQDNLLLVTRQGKAICFSEDEVRSMGLSAAGVMAIKLGKDDAVVGMGVVDRDTHVILFTEKGYAKRTAAKEFPTQKRYGGGVLAIKLSKRSGPVVAAVLASEKQSLVLMAAKGRVTQLPVKAVRAMGRAATGSKNPVDTKEPYVDLAAHGPPSLLTVLAGTEATAKGARARRTAATKKGESRRSRTTKAK